MTLHIILFLISIGVGVILAYNNYRFVVKNPINIWVLLAISILLVVSGMTIVILERSFIGDILFYAGMTCSIYAAVSLSIWGNEPEDEEPVSEASSLDERIQEMVDKSKK